MAASASAVVAESRDSVLFSHTLPLICFLSSGVVMTLYHHWFEPSTSTTSSSLYQRVAEQGPDALTTLDKILFVSVILLAFELLDFITRHSGQWMGSKRIPVRGKHLDDLSAKDHLFIGISKAATAPFVYFYFRYAFFEPNTVWSLNQVSLSNILLPLVPLFIVYDFFYTILHWFLHLQFIYGAIHKHHHQQKAPSRANVDAINVHPIEFFLGEYNHLLALTLVTQCCHVHVLGALLFLAIGGIGAGINHTRYDLVLNIFGMHVYDSKAHDVHHRIPQSNYGQYTMLWDWVFGTYRAYNPADRVNPAAQLDPATGKSLSYRKSR